jgi:diguanylate cyclase (GGDEF)-like protein/PAS domain S-box-containing protein
MVVTDISQEREVAAAAEELRSRRDRFEAMVQHSSDLIAVVGADGRVAYASRAVSELFGVDPGVDGAVGADPLVGVLAGDRAGVAAALQYAMSVPGVHGPVQCRIVRADGSRRVVEGTATNLLDDPDVGGVVLACRDVTSQAEANDALRQRAFSDPLTGLATRDVLLDRLGTALAAAHETGDTVAVLFVDLDRFKQVNDRFGHGDGDALLVAVAAALAGAVRPGDMLARHGGDEFVVLLDTVRNEREARSIAERARLALRVPVVLPGGTVVEAGASIGVALSDPSSTPAGMLRDADSAMYRAKQSGRDRVEVFDEALRLRAARRVETEAALRQALDGDGLALRFEPVADLVDGGIVGAEARVRLRLPSGEVVPVGELLPLAQEVGLSTDVVSDALEAACRAAGSWSAETGLGRWVGLDVSAGEVTHPTFIDRLARILAATGVEAGAIGLELPIDVVTTEASLTGRAIAAVRALGVRVVLDGVGAELRSLAALGAFPVDGIKLDLDVLPDVLADPVAAAVAASVGEVAGAAGVPVIVVGADRPEQLDVVRRLGFRYVQGLAVAPLVDEVDLVALRR